MYRIAFLDARLAQGIPNAHGPQNPLEAHAGFVVIPVGHQCSPLNRHTFDAPFTLTQVHDLEVFFVRRRRDLRQSVCRRRLNFGDFVEHVLHLVEQSIHILSGHRANCHAGQVAAIQRCFDFGPTRLGVGQIHLVEGHNLGLVGQCRIEEDHLLVDGFEITQRVRAVAGEDVNECTRALDVAQKLVPQPDAFMRALHQSGNVGQDDLAMIDFGHTQIGGDRGKGVVRDFRFGRTDDTQQSGLARIGDADDADVGHKLEFELQPLFFAGFALFGQARRLVAGRLEGGIAAAAAAAGRDQRFLALPGQVGHDGACLGLAHKRAGWNRDAQIRTVGAGLVGAAAVDAPFGPIVYLILERCKRIEPGIDIENDVAAPAAVAAVGPPSGDEFFPPERDDAVAAISSFHIDSCFIEKHSVIVTTQPVKDKSEKSRGAFVNGLHWKLLPLLCEWGYNAAMADKIIHSFQTRRQLGQAFDELEATSNEVELIRQAQTVVQQFDEDLVLGELVRRLDTASSQMRGGLGHVAALLSSDQVGATLRGAAGDRQNSPQARITAALLLERFLGEDLPAGIMSDLDQSNEVAMQSLREAIEESAQNRHILLEYVTQMRETDAGIALAVMEMLSQLPPTDQVELLRLIAQDSRVAVTQHALHQLEQLGSSEVGEAAARALHILAQMLPPQTAALAGRSLRKLQFSGVHYAPSTPEGWHALLSPADVVGNQTVWFVRRPTRDAVMGAIVGFGLDGETGINQFFAGENIARTFLPGAPGPGQQVLVEIGGPQPMLMLQVPFDYARWLVAHALERHWETEEGAHLSDEYQLYGDLIWEFATPETPPQLRAYFVPPDEGGEPPAMETERPTLSELAEFSGDLLRIPVMMGWFHQFQAVLIALDFQTLEVPATADDTELLILTERTLAELSQRRAAREVRTAMNIALRRQAAWLDLAGDATAARRAHLLADHLPHHTIQQDPLLTALIAGSLRQMGLTT